MDKLVACFSKLSQRERVMVLVGGVIVGLLLIYSLIVSPLNSANMRLSTRLQSNQHLLNWMEEANDELHVLSHVRMPEAKPSLALVQEALFHHGMKPDTFQLTQRNMDHYGLQLNAVNFDGLMGAILSLHQRYGLSAAELTLKLQSPGVVSGVISLVLQPS